MTDRVLTAGTATLSTSGGPQTSAESPLTKKSTSLSKADIQLCLNFDLGAVQMSLAEIEQLVPGRTFLLNRDPELTVQLKCCGQTMGEARLVQVNGQLAVQVAKFLRCREGAAS